MKNILVVGGISRDLIIRMDSLPSGKPGSIFSSSSNWMIGGTGAGKALNLAALGFTTTLHAFLAEDENGAKIKSYMADQPIRFIAERDPAATASFTNLVDKNGQRISIFTAYCSHEPELDLSSIKQLITKADIVVLNITNYARQLIPLCKAEGKEIWTDIHDYDLKNEYHNDFIEAADMIQMSSDHIPNYRSFMEKLINQGKKLVVCTHGKLGASAINATGEWAEEPIISDYKTVDINGAGDSFFSGFLYAHVSGKNLRDCLRYGTLAAGLCVGSTELYSRELSPVKIESEYTVHYSK